MTIIILYYNLIIPVSLVIQSDPKRCTRSVMNGYHRDYG